MFGWLKRFTLSLFSDRQAKESVRQGFGNILITALLAFVFVFFGIFTGKYVTFGADYDNARGFRGFLYNAFIRDDGGAEFTVTATDGGAEITIPDGRVAIDTFSNADDARRYSSEGYDLIVDTRNTAYVFVEFTAFCRHRQNGTRIPYEDWRALSKEKQSEYYFAAEYSAAEKIISSEDAREYISYLETIEDARDELKAVIDGKNDLTQEQYFNALYELYIKHYYPDMYASTGENAPTLRNYYYMQTLNAERGYFCLFGDMITASFKSTAGKTVNFGCRYADGVSLFASDAAAERGELDGFIKNLYYKSLSVVLLVEALNCLSVILFTELIIVAFMLICRYLCKWKNVTAGATFANSAKLVSSFTQTGALLCAVVTALAGFVVGARFVAFAAYISYALILGVRLAVFVANEIRRERAADGVN